MTPFKYLILISSIFILPANASNFKTNATKQVTPDKYTRLLKQVNKQIKTERKTNKHFRENNTNALSKVTVITIQGVQYMFTPQSVIYVPPGIKKTTKALMDIKGKVKKTKNTSLIDTIQCNYTPKTGYTILDSSVIKKDKPIIALYKNKEIKSKLTIK